jgi:hypothetical protein
MSLLISGDLRLAKGQPVPNDPNFAFNSLLLHGNGTNGSTVITDSSGSPKTVTAVGNAQISTAQSKFGGASIAFDGSGDYLTVLNSSQFNFGVDDFTIEAWCYRTSTATAFEIVSYGNPGADGLFFGSTTSAISFGTGPAVVLASSSTSLALNVWTHIAVTRSSNVTRVFANGIAGATTTNALNNLNSTTVFRVGINRAVNVFATGYIDDLRITKGVARYTANFTPPTAPFPDF